MISSLVVVQIVFWLCLLSLAYTYLVYPVVLLVCYLAVQVKSDWKYLTSRRDRRIGLASGDECPGISIVIAAYNEERDLQAKLENLRFLSYPKDKLEVVFVSDGSSDQTNAILASAESEQIRVIILPERRGKSNALNHGVDQARHEILIFSDAATLFEPDAITKFARHFADPKVGVVCGALRFVGSAESQQTEGVYWKYESMLRLMESRLGATLTASGAMYAVRKECFVPLKPSTLIEDLVVPMTARSLSFRVLYDPEAIGTEFAADSVEGEFGRRVRIAVGSFRALADLGRIPLRGFTCLAFLSHKVMRWIAPFFLLGLVLSNVALWNSGFYPWILSAQMCFYAWAALGYLMSGRLQRVRYVLLGYFMVAMNLAFLVGFVRYISGAQVPWRQHVAE